MAVTRLKRKGRRNIVRAKNKQKTIQRLKAAPVVKNVDIEKIKEEFSKKGVKAEKKNSKDADKAETMTPKAKSKAAPKKKKA